MISFLGKSKIINSIFIILALNVGFSSIDTNAIPRLLAIHLTGLYVGGVYVVYKNEMEKQQQNKEQNSTQTTSDINESKIDHLRKNVSKKGGIYKGPVTAALSWPVPLIKDHLMPVGATLGLMYALIMHPEKISITNFVKTAMKLSICGIVVGDLVKIAD